MVSFTDIFCGAGGSATGLTAAGMELALAANHWQRAIETHAANHRDAEHLCADISNYDMRALPSTDVLWASPICTEISPAGGRKRTRGQLDLLDNHGDNDPGANAFIRTRATFHDVIRATEVHRYQAVLVENVVNVASDWELFDWWVQGMCLLGYQVQFVSVSSAHVGDAGNPPAPQWRDRLYIVFTRDGIPTPDVTPRPLAWCAVCDQDVAAVQSWRNPRRRKIGKYRQQYDYRCPHAHCRHTLVEPYVRPAASVIDWSEPGVRIGDREATGLRPLRPNTLRRIRAGLELFDASTTASDSHEGPGRTVPPTAAPLPSRATTIGDGIAHPPFLAPSGGTWNETPSPIDSPLRTRPARETDGLVCPEAFVAMLRNHGRSSSVHSPLATMAASGNHHALVVPYRRGAQPHRPDRPLSTVATRDAHGLLHGRGDLTVEDCRFRMLQPREQLAAQRFPYDYVMTGTRTEQTAQAGNAVSSNVAQWLGQRLLAVL